MQFNKRNRPWIKLKDLYMISFLRKHYRLWRQEITRRESENKILGIRLYLVKMIIIERRQYLTPANLLTAMRALLAYPLFELIEHEMLKAALVVYGVMVISDFIDGPIAFGFYHVTTTGKKLDPIADKCGTIALSLALRQHLPNLIFYPLLGMNILLFVLANIVQPLANALGSKFTPGSNDYGRYKFGFECAGFAALFIYKFISIDGSPSFLWLNVSYLLLTISIFLAVASAIEHMLPRVISQSIFHKIPLSKK